jgi:two-component system, NtrC family, sensor histidine kinase HydH
MQRSKWEWFFSWRAFLLLWGPIFLITAAHYGTPATYHWLHDIFRRLYYIPIVLGAFYFGLKGALCASILASLVYMPHAFLNVSVADPANSMEKGLEILLYNVVALITGILAARERAERERQQGIAERLQATLVEKEELEQQLIRSGRLQALGELTAGLAHEIKNPLASIKGSSEVIADEVAAESPRRKMVEIQKRELNRLESLLDRFLNFARPSSVDIGAVDIRVVVDHVITLSASHSGKLGVTVAAHATEPHIIVRGDKEQLTQVVLNLLLNALDASPANGEVTVSLSTRTRRGKKFGCIQVSDQGPGVPQDLSQKIFNPFFTTKDDGSGLGLSIAARIIDQHNGYLEVSPPTSEPGANFTAWIPAVDDVMP